MDSSMPMSALSRIVLLTGLAAAALPGVAQFDTPVQTLAPALTDNSANAPVTTLSIDLLAPQRVFTYDATGASIFASALDPTVRADVDGAVAQTDTALRDSSQTGQISPYGPGGSRLSALFSGSGPALRSGSLPSPSPRADLPDSLPGMASDEPYGAGAGTAGPTRDDAYRSSWGATSAMGSPTLDAGWSGRSGTASGPGTASEAATPLASGYQSGSDLPAAQSSAGAGDPFRGRPASSLGWRSPSLTRSRPTASAFPSTEPTGPTAFGTVSTDRLLSDPGQPPGQDASALPAQVETQPFDRLPLRALGGFASPLGSFGQNLSNFGQESFLRPDILTGFAAPTSRRTGSASFGRPRTGPGPSPSGDESRAGASRYGLAANTFSPHSERGADRRKVNPRPNLRLTGEEAAYSH